MFSLINLSSNFEKSMFNSFSLNFSLALYFITLAGTPPTIAYGGTSLQTKAPAAITAPCPIVTPERIVAE